MSYVQPVYLQGGTPAAAVSQDAGLHVAAPGHEGPMASVSETVNTSSSSTHGDAASIAAAAIK